MGGVENHPVARFTHPIERTEIGDEIVVAEAGSTLCKSKLVVAEAGKLFRDILHVPRGEELTFLYVHDPPGFGCRPEQICLPAKERGDLENVDALTRDLRFCRRMDIGCHWDFQFGSDGRENFASFADPVNWTAEDLKPYVDHAISVFGEDRVVFGGDWPPLLTANSTYARWVETLDGLTSGMSEAGKRKLFGDNARSFYRLPPA